MGVTPGMLYTTNCEEMATDVEQSGRLDVARREVGVGRPDVSRAVGGVADAGPDPVAAVWIVTWGYFWL